MNEQEFEKIVGSFDIKETVKSVRPYGDGHINDTYLVETDGRKYILQRINDSIFRDVDMLMSNIEKVLAHAKKNIAAAGGDPDRETMTLVSARCGKSYVRADGGCWRVYLSIDNTVSLNLARSDEDFYQSGVAFGKFARMLDGFDVDEIRDVIPNFHNTVSRYRDFTASLNADKAGRKAKCEEEIKFVTDHAYLANKIVDMLNSGEIPRRVTHNDTKLNNVLLDAKTGKAVAVIDLDTVMGGSVVYDFGDSVRFGCSTALEDEADLNKVHFSMQLFDVYSRGFIGAMKGVITDREVDALPLGSVMMTYECGIRFLADYLGGDTYFKVAKPDHNLIRSRTQFRLVSEMLERYDEMLNVVRKYAK